MRIHSFAASCHNCEIHRPLRINLSTNNDPEMYVRTITSILYILVSLRALHHEIPTYIPKARVLDYMDGVEET